MTECDTILKKEKITEREFELFLLDNINIVSKNCHWGKITRIERQCSMAFNDGAIRCDIMLWHEDGTGTCIEVKMGHNNRNDDLMGLGQLLFYGLCIEKRLTNKPRLVLVCPNIKNSLWDIIKAYNLPICLLELTDDKCIYLSNGTR